jgi:FkbM family methyltransferase
MVPYSPITVQAFILANLLYKHAFWLYRPMYFLYKRMVDHRTLRLIRPCIRPGAVTLDIGANIGFYTVNLARWAGPSGKVHAFEADEMNFERLLRTTKGLPGVVATRSAVGATGGEARLSGFPLNVGHYIAQDRDEVASKIVPLVAVDDYFTRGESVDFIKMDIEGYECHALRGMEHTIRRSPAVRIVGELYPYALRRAGTDVHTLLDLLRSLDLAVTLSADRAAVDASAHDPFFISDFVAVRSVASGLGGVPQDLGRR